MVAVVGTLQTCKHYQPATHSCCVMISSNKQVIIVITTVVYCFLYFFFLDGDTGVRIHCGLLSAPAVLIRRARITGDIRSHFLSKIGSIDCRLNVDND